MKNILKESEEPFMDERWIGLADICEQLQHFGTVRELCETSLRLIKERLSCERISLYLNKDSAHYGDSFYGLYDLDHPIETEEDFLRIGACFPDDGSGSPEVVENVALVDFDGKSLGQADCLYMPLLHPTTGQFGYLIADNLLGKTPWDTASIQLFRIFSAFFMKALLFKESEVIQERKNLQLRTLIDSLPAYIYIKDTDGRFLLANKCLAQSNGVDDPDDMLGKSDFDYFPAEQAQGFFEKEQSLLQHGAPLKNIEEVGHDGDGNENWTLSTKIPLKDEQGNVFSLVGIGLDITEKKRDQQKVVESEKCYRTLFNSISDAILVHAVNGQILDCNDQAQDLFGYGSEKLLQSAVEDLNVHGYAKHLKETDFSGCNYQEVVETNRGQELCVKIKSIPIKYRNDSAYLTLFQDVTELDAARKSAENTAKAKSAFLANMSHEIRTPLNAVIGMTSLLADGEMLEEQREFVQIIQTSGEALLSLVNDILDLSKIDAGAMQLEEVPFNLRHCVENSLDIVAPKAAEQGLELACCIEGDVPEVFIGDSARLRQVLLNLLSNAIKFTHEGEVVTRVAGRPVAGERHCLDFSVTDTGIGMTPEVAAKVLKPFEQADTSTTRQFGGTGLGLSICNKLVDMMGGSLQIKSQVGVGSEFSISITLKRTEDDDLAQTTINKELVKGCRVLVVDDNSTNLQILEYQLQQWDAIPLIFTSGADALENLCDLGQIDLAILDMLMPEMDGEMLGAALRKRPEFWNHPILILSSSANASISENPSANAWLTKPAKPDQMLEKISMLLESAESGKLTASSKAVKPAINATLGETHPLRILVAEDNVVNQIVARKMLSHMGYEADLAKNGQIALEAVASKTYDLVLMDIQMPVMDGIEATKKILERYPDGECPMIVAMTAHALQECREEGLESGMSDYLTKPIKVEDLVIALKKVPRRPIEG